MARRGPKLFVERLFEELKVDDDGTYIVIYSTKDHHPPSDFYRNLRRLMELAKIESPVRGALICRGYRVANIAYRLASKYCRKVVIFKVEKVS